MPDFNQLQTGQPWHAPCLREGRKKNKPQEGKTMMTLWIVLGALFMTGIGVRFTYRVLGLTPVEATAVFVMIVTLVGVNTGPARQLLMNLF
jgi:hypothetical protein